MRCRDLQHLLDRGQPLADPTARAHLETCADCRTRAAGVDPQRPALPPQPEVNLDAMLATVESAVAAETGFRARLRELPTPRRWLSAGLVTVLIQLVTLLVTPRADLAVYPMERMGLVLLPLLVLALLAFRLGLVRLDRPAAAAWKIGGGLGLALAVPIVLAALPAAASFHPASGGGIGHDLVPKALACFLFGAITGLPVLVLLRWLDRGSRDSLVPALFAAAAGAIAGNFALQLHCPIVHPHHLLLGHGSVILGLVPVAGAAAWMRGRG